jgi:hypothetical protein
MVYNSVHETNVDLKNSDSFLREQKWWLVLILSSSHTCDAMMPQVDYNSLLIIIQFVSQLLIFASYIENMYVGMAYFKINCDIYALLLMPK